MSENKEKKRLDWRVAFILVIFLLAIILKLYSFYWPKMEIKINNQTLNVLVAKNYKHWAKGLGGRSDLGDYDGMLFVFNSPVQHTIVMRDMEFPIDIIWINQGRIIDIAPNAAVEPGKTEGQYFPYMARSVSTHVLEVPAGMAASRGWRIGDIIEFNP